MKCFFKEKRRILRMSIYISILHNIVCDTEKPATKPQKWSIKNPLDKLTR